MIQIFKKVVSESRLKPHITMETRACNVKLCENFARKILFSKFDIKSNGIFIYLHTNTKMTAFFLTPYKVFICILRLSEKPIGVTVTIIFSVEIPPSTCTIIQKSYI